jgi:predicted RNA-binding protein with RPS1 domain
MFVGNTCAFYHKGKVELSMNEAAKKAKREYAKKWREKNRERYNEYMKEWRNENKEKIQQYQENYWTKKAKEA